MGSGPECDINLLKLNVSYGHSFLIILESGKYKLIDVSNTHFKFEPFIKLAPNVERPIAKNSLVNFGGSFLFSITNLTQQKLELEYIDKILDDA